MESFKDYYSSFGNLSDMNRDYLDITLDHAKAKHIPLKYRRVNSNGEIIESTFVPNGDPVPLTDKELRDVLPILDENDDRYDEIPDVRNGGLHFNRFMSISDIMRFIEDLDAINPKLVDKILQIAFEPPEPQTENSIKIARHIKGIANDIKGYMGMNTENPIGTHSKSIYDEPDTGPEYHIKRRLKHFH